MRRLALALSFAFALGCSAEQPSKPNSEAPPRQPETKPETKPEPPTVDDQTPKTELESLPAKDGFFMAKGAPDPRACTVADDCTGNTIPDLDNPCCQDPSTLEPYARAYWTWINEWRRDHCEAVTCPPPPAPSMPPDCAFEPDCVDGVCVDTCP